MALVARKTWILELGAYLTASQAASMSLSLQRASPQMVAPRIVWAICLTDSKSPGEAIGKPASITSTPISASNWATSSFSARFMLAPGDCSPSRSVVSKIRIKRGCVLLRNLGAWITGRRGRGGHRRGYLFNRCENPRIKTKKPESRGDSGHVSF